MTLAEARAALDAVESRLADSIFTVVCSFERDGQALRLAVTERLRKLARRGRVWKSAPFLTAFKNGAYGFDEAQARSPGGSDGIFLLDRTYRPANEMMRKLFDRYLNKPGSGAAEVAAALDTRLDDLLPVRLVSHHMRLLGLLHRTATVNTLVLVDYDDTK